MRDEQEAYTNWLAQQDADKAFQKLEGADREREQMQATIDELVKACEKFSQAHGYPDGESTDACVDPQYWAEFDDAIAKVKGGAV